MSSVPKNLFICPQAHSAKWGKVFTFKNTGTLTKYFFCFLFANNFLLLQRIIIKKKIQNSKILNLL